PPERRQAILEASRRYWDNARQAQTEADFLAMKRLDLQYDEPILPNKHEDSFERELFKEFQSSEPAKNEATRERPGEQVLPYYGAIRAHKTRLECHRKTHPNLAEKDLMAIVHIRLPTKAISDAVNINRAFLMSTAIVTALLIMFGSYVIVRYVIVKPVKHL